MRNILKQRGVKNKSNGIKETDKIFLAANLNLSHNVDLHTPKLYEVTMEDNKFQFFRFKFYLLSYSVMLEFGTFKKNIMVHIWV